MTEIIIMQPNEWYLEKHLRSIGERIVSHGITLTIVPNTQFFISHETFIQAYPTPPVMETFYRWMRKKEGILMEGEKKDKPIGGVWNYDKENRTFDKKHSVSQHMNFSHPYIDKAIQHYAYDTEILPRLEHGDYPITREHALSLLEYFITHHLDNFGRLEDAMYTSDIFVYHSKISTSINF
jgi:deoxyribodipyrimidine photolyase-related protein